MAYTQQILYQVQLPEFLTKFKQACLGQLLPPIDSAIQFLKTTSSPLLIVLLIVLFVELLRLAILQVKSTKVQNVSQQGDSRATAREVKDLKRQLKGMQKTVQQLKELGLSSSAGAGKASAISSIGVRSVIDSCKDSWVKRQEVALHIVEYQTLLMNSVRQLKRSGSRISSPSKISNSSPKVPNANVKSNVPTSNRANPKSDAQVPAVAKKVEIPVVAQQNTSIPKNSKLQAPSPAVKVNSQFQREEVRAQLPKMKEQTAKQFVKPQIQEKNQQVFEPTTIVETPAQLESEFLQQNSFKNQGIALAKAQIPKNEAETIQQTKKEQRQTANHLEDIKEQKQVTLQQSPRVMPPLPKQPPPVARRAPGPPLKGQKRNPPPPPVRKT